MHARATAVPYLHRRQHAAASAKAFLGGAQRAVEGGLYTLHTQGAASSKPLPRALIGALSHRALIESTGPGLSSQVEFKTSPMGSARIWGIARCGSRSVENRSDLKVMIRRSASIVRRAPRSVAHAAAGHQSGTGLLERHSTRARATLHLCALPHPTRAAPQAGIAMGNPALSKLTAYF